MTTPGPDATLVEPAALRKLRGLQAEDGTEITAALIPMFAEATERAIREMTAVMAARPADLEEARRLAHSLRGSAAIVGASAVVDLAGAIEARASSGESHLIPTLLARLAAIVPPTLSELQAEQAKMAAEGAG